MTKPPPADLSATTMVYENLRLRILRGELPSGTLLVEQEVADELKVSRTPVHEALRRLGAEGLLDVSHRRRARVAFVSLHDTQQLYAIRNGLEQIACEDAATQIDGPALARLEEATAHMEEIARNWSTQRLREFIDVNTRFHMGILEAANNRWLSKTLVPIMDMLLGPMNSFAVHPVAGEQEVRHDFLVRNCRQHREIIDALRAADPGWAREAMRLHVHSAHRDWGNAAEAQRLEEEAGRGRRRRRRKAPPAAAPSSTTGPN